MNSRTWFGSCRIWSVTGRPEGRIACPTAVRRTLLTYAAGGLGSGASIVMLTEVVRELGGFDPALGPATLACGGEQIDLLARLLHRGYALAYEADALVWREHPAHAGHQRRQIYRHGIGVGAMIGKRLIAGPGAPPLVGRDPGRNALRARSRAAPERRPAGRLPSPPQMAHAPRDAHRPGRIPFERFGGARAPAERQAVVKPTSAPHRAAAGLGWGDDQHRLVQRGPGTEGAILLAPDRRARGGGP